MGYNRKDYMKIYNQLPKVKQQKREWKKKHIHTPEYLFNRRRNQEQCKMDCFFIYSDGYMKCKKCGYENISALTLDHINNDGAKERKQFKLAGYGSTFFRYLKQNNFPDGYQVLCRNCNWEKHLEYIDSKRGD